MGDKSNGQRGHHLLHQQKYLAAYATDQNSDQQTGHNRLNRPLSDRADAHTNLDLPFLHLR